MQITTTRTDNGPQDVTGKIFLDRGHMRMNLETAGHQTGIITDFATKTTDILMMRQQMYMEHKAGDMPARGPGSMTQDLKPYDPEHPCAHQPDVACKKIGVEEVSGRTCDHWEMTGKDGKVLNVWVDQKLHFAIKVVSEDSTVTLSNITEGQPEASLFEIPAGFRKLEMGAIPPPGMGGPPHR